MRITVVHYSTLKYSINIVTSWEHNKTYNTCYLTHWGRVTHICVKKLTIIGSDNGLWPDRRQAIIWTNAGILLIGPLGTNFSEISIEILTFSIKKMRLKVSSAKRRPFCLGLNVLIVSWPSREMSWKRQAHIWLFVCGIEPVMRSFEVFIGVIQDKLSNKPSSEGFTTGHWSISCTTGQ